MRRLLLAALLAAAWPSGAGTNGPDVQFNLVELTGTAHFLKPFALYPYGQGTNMSGQLVSRDRYMTNSGPTGSLVISNVTGGVYYSVLQGNSATTTNWFIFPVTNGFVNASSYLKDRPGGWLLSNGGGVILWDP